MTHKLSLRQQVFLYLKNNPNASNERLKKQFEDSNWNSVRTYKAQFFNEYKRENDLDTPVISRDTIRLSKSKFDTLDEKTIEQLIIDLLNDEPTESRIKLAVDFHNKVKGTDVMRLEEPIDMEGFLDFELSERKAQSS